MNKIKQGITPHINEIALKTKPWTEQNVAITEIKNIIQDGQYKINGSWVKVSNEEKKYLKEILELTKFHKKPGAYEREK